MQDNIVVTGNLPDKLMDQGIDIMAVAFNEKFQGVFKNPAHLREVYRFLIQNHQLLYIEQHEVLQGILLHSTCDTDNIITIKKLCKTFGMTKGITTYLKLLFMKHKVNKGEIYINFLAVCQRSRGKGVGTKLIDCLEQYAKNNQFINLTLYVVDTNENARNLYNKVGFKSIKVESVGILVKIYKLNFTKFILMEKRFKTN